jgi:hypothetical protein
MKQLDVAFLIYPLRGGEKYSSHLLVRTPWNGKGKFEIK